MGSVNANVRAALPITTSNSQTADEAPGSDAQAPATPATRPGWGLTQGLYAMGSSVGSTLTDVATFAGVKRDDEGGLQAAVDPFALGGFAAATTGPTALMALGNRVDPLTGISTSYVDRLGATAATNAIRVTPTLVSAVLGPAVADGVTLLAPNLVKKYTDTKDIRDATVKKQAEKDNQRSKITRAVVGGAVVGLAAGAAFLLKPDLFKKFNVNFVSDEAIQGATKYVTSTGRSGSLAGVVTASQIGERLTQIGKPLLSSETVNIVKTVSPMARDAAFSNRVMLSAAGGLGTLLLANKAAGEDDPDRQKLLWGITAAAGAMTVGAGVGIGKLTERSIQANGGAGGLLAKNDLLWKPNIEWVKSYASKIAPITAVPAGTAASQYFNVVNDFDEITSTRSPFRK